MEKHTQRLRDTQRHRETHTLWERDTQKMTDTHIQRNPHTQWERHTYNERDTNSETDTYTQRDTYTHWETHTETLRETDIQRETQTQLRESFPRQVDKKSRGPQEERGLEFSRRKKGQSLFFFPLHSLGLYNNNVSCQRTVSGLNLLANSVTLKYKVWE